MSDATSITYTETSTDGDPSIVKLYSTSDDVDDGDPRQKMIVLLKPMLWVIASMLQRRYE